MAFDPNDPLGQGPLYDSAPPPWQGDPSALAMPPPVPFSSSPDMGAPPPVTPPQEVGAPTLDGAVPPPDLGVPTGVPTAAPDLGFPGGLPPVGAPGDFGVPPPASFAGEAPGPPPLAPDAITGAMPAPAFGSTGYGPNLTPEQHYAQTAAAYAGHPQDIPDQGERDRAATELSIQHPVDFELYKQHLAARKAADLAAAQYAASEANLAAIKQDVENRQKADAITQVKQDAITADALKLANTPMDRNRWFRDKSLGGQIATVGVALIGGLLQGANGGRNTGMDWITGSIDKDIDDQKADLENKRAGIGIRQGAVAQEFARTGNLYQAAEVVRLASYQVALDHLATMQQDYDPRGTSFASIGQGMQDLAARQQQAKEIQRKELHTESLADIKEDRERALAASTIRHQANEDAIASQRLGLEKAKAKAEEVPLSPAQIAQQFPEFPASAIPASGMTVGDATKRAELYNKTLEGANKITANAMQQAGTQVIGADGTPLTVDGKPTGKPVLAPTSAIAEKLNESVSGGQDLLTSLGDVRRFLAKDPSAFDRNAWADAKTQVENAKFAFAKLHDTKASSRELEAMKELFGPDPDSYVARRVQKGVMLSHIDALTRDAKNTVANKLRHIAKYTGPSVLVESGDLPDTVETSDDRDLQHVMAEPDLSKLTRDDEFKVEGEAGDVIPKSYHAVIERWISDARGLDPQTAEQIAGDLRRPPGDSLRVKAEAALKDAEAKRTTAIQNLAHAAGTPTERGSNSYGVQILARKALVDLASASVASTPGEPEQVR